MHDTIIIKFGGSSVSPADIKLWVAAIEQATKSVVLVPGGGPFADTVKTYQSLIGYSDDAAHHMAILAMEQFGRALISLGERLVPAATVEAIEAALALGQIPVWMPAKLASRADELGRGWGVTSDSLAAFLAARMPGATLCLIKQLDVPAGSTMDAITNAGVVDEGFVDLLHPATRVFVAGPSDLARCGRRLSEGGPFGREIERELRILDAAQ